MVDSKYLIRDGVGKYFDLYKGLTTNCKPNTKTLSQIYPNFKQSKVLQIEKLQLTNLKDYKPEYVCETKQTPNNKLVKLGRIPIPYRPIDEFEITSMELGLEETSDGFYQLRGYSHNDTGIAKITVDPDNEYTAIDTSLFHYNLFETINGKSIKFHGHSIFLPNLYIELSHTVKDQVKIVNEHTVLSTGSIPIRGTKFELLIRPTDKLFTYTFQTTEHTDLKRFEDAVMTSKKDSKLQSYLVDVVPANLVDFVEEETKRTEVKIDDLCSRSFP